MDTWLEVIEREKLRTDGHIGPTGVGNLPRPKEQGPCRCPMCEAKRAILEEEQRQAQAEAEFSEPAVETPEVEREV